MAKWADYGISAVRYSDGHQHIACIRAHRDNGDSIGLEEIYERSQVVAAINRGTSFVTILKSGESKWLKGQPVIVVRINGVDYIKTTNNSQANDNLENLPEF